MRPESGAGPVLAVAVLLASVFAVGGLAATQHARLSEAAQVDPLPGLEAAAEADPGDLAARLRLAHHHFDNSDYDVALSHYLAVLDHQRAHPRALARSGWIAFEGGQPDLAERLLAESLELAPDDPEALWFVAHVRLYGKDDPLAAATPLRTLLTRTDLSEGFRAQVESLLRQAERGL